MSLAPALETTSLVTERMSAAMPRCLYCGCVEFTPLYQGVRDRLGHVPGEWSFVQCVDCRSAQLRPFPRTDDLSAFYPPVYTFAPELAQSSIKRLLSEIEYRFFFRPVYRSQANIVDRKVRRPGEKPGRLLDLGCGKGLRLLDFRRLGYEVQGTDFVPDSVEYVRSTLGIPAVCTDTMHLAKAFPSDSFDVITAFHLIEHVTEIDSVLSAVNQLLKPGGWFAISGPLGDSANRDCSGAAGPWPQNAPRHVTIPTCAGLNALLLRNGFDGLNERATSDPSLACAARHSSFADAAMCINGSLRLISHTSNSFSPRGIRSNICCRSLGFLREPSTANARPRGLLLVASQCNAIQNIDPLTVNQPPKIHH